MKFTLLVIFVALTKISFGSLVESNTMFRINSENAQYSLISIPKTKFTPRLGETIIIDNKTQKQLWKIDEYLNYRYRIYLSNDGMSIILLDHFIYVDSIPSNPLIIRHISINGNGHSFTFKELFNRELERNNDIMPAISGFYKVGDSLTLLTLDDSKVVIDLNTFNKSTPSKANEFDIEKSINENRQNQFVDIDSQEIRIDKKRTSFFEELLKELKKHYDVTELTDKENLEVAIFITLKITNGEVEIWDCAVAIKTSQSSIGYKVDDEVRQKVEARLKSLSYVTESPYDASSWIYTLNYYLK